MTDLKGYQALYGHSLSLLTDLYQLTMAYGYWKAGMQDHEACFYHSYRKIPFSGGFVVACGLEGLIYFLDQFKIDSSDLAYLETIEGKNGKPLFERAFLDYLVNLKLTCTIHAVPEGTPVFPYEPIVRVQGSLIQCQLLETAILNLMNFPSLIATKAARVRTAARNDTVVEFGLRRSQGIDGGVTASRAAYIGGCDASSNVLAGKLFGIPVRGTHAHSWIMAFDDELDAFECYAEQLPANCIFLVDTYNTLEGVRNAVRVGKKLRTRGHEMIGIRLDSGDLANLSIESRKILDEEGFPDALIMASNELDEYLIRDLKQQGAAITTWGVGTNLVTAKDHPALDGVYKLSAIRQPGGEWKQRLKLSEQMIKVSNPGILQVRRFFDGYRYLGDAIYDEQTPVGEKWTVIDPLDSTRVRRLTASSQDFDLLVPIYENGNKVYQQPSLKEIQSYTRDELSRFPDAVKRFNNPHQYIMGLEQNLYDSKISIVRELRQKSSL